MTASESIIRYIKKQEGLRLNPYELYGKWHIGYGHLLHPGSASFPPITEAEADKILRKDIIIAEQAVDRFITIKMNQDQYDALVDFTYNRGSGTLQNSTLREKVNTYGSKQEIEQAFQMHNKAGGQINEGLRKRRKYEADLFNGNPFQRFYTKNRNAVLTGSTIIIIVIVIYLVWRWNRKTT